MLHDGDTVELGGATLTARLTPGHTPGCTTWTMQVSEGSRKLNAVIVGSPNVNRGYVLVGNQRYPQIAEDYAKAFAVWQGAPIDIFLGAHGDYFDLEAKYAKMKSGAANPFVSIPSPAVTPATSAHCRRVVVAHRSAAKMPTVIHNVNDISRLA